MFKARLISNFNTIDLFDCFQTKLPQRPQVKRSSPLTAQQWASHIDSEGRMKDLDALKETIFRGVSTHVNNNPS